MKLNLKKLSLILLLK